MVLSEIAERTPIYGGMTLDEIGGDGVRWQEREASLAAARETLGELRFSSPSTPPASLEPSNGSLALATVADLWASWECERSPALDFLPAEQELQLHPSDGERLGVAPGDEVEVASNGHAVRAVVRLREGARPGSALLTWGTLSENANVLVDGTPVLVEMKKPGMMLPLADTQFVETTGVWIIKSLVIFVFVLAVVPMVLLLERKLLGRFQNRYGPNRVGPFGLLQPLADVGKLLGKEQSVPRTGVPLLMALAPAITIVTAVASFAIIPFGNVKEGFGSEYGLYGIDVNIGILYAFAFGSLAFYGLLLGGWASGSKYSFLGAMRSAAQLISYEVSLTLALIGVIMMAGSLSLVDIVLAQGNVWYVLPQFVGFLIFTVAGFAETNRPPFDLPEADAELVVGLQHRVRGHALRLVLHGRVHKHAGDRRHRGGALPRRVDGTRAGLPGPALDDPQDVLHRLLLHLGAGDAAAPALRPAHELRMEGAAAAGDAQPARDRCPRDGALMEARLNVDKLDWAPPDWLDTEDVIAVQRGPEPGGAGGFYRAFARDVARPENDSRAPVRGSGHDPVPRGEDPRLPRAFAAVTSSTASRTPASRSASAARSAPPPARPTASASSRPRTRPSIASRRASATPRSTRSTSRRCIFCGYCEVACPFDAITMGHDYELSDYNRSDLIFTKEMLLAEPIERTPLRRDDE